MNIISDIQQRRSIVEISADGCVCLKVRKQHFAKRPLAIGEAVDLEVYENSIASIQFSDAYECALSLLDLCARTAKELEKNLLSKGYVPTVVSSVIERLLENHLIDDRQLAGRIAESSANKAVGVYAVKRKLRAKGISEADASEALEMFDDAQQKLAACQAAQKLCRRYKDLPAREARAKLSQALARRGFPWDAISEAVDALLNADDDFGDSI